MEQNNNNISFHSRFGLRFLQVLLIVFALLLIQRCVALYHENKMISEQMKKEYFDHGYENGLKKAQGHPAGQEPQFKNYSLKKSYLEGFRQGWDKGRQPEQ